MKNFLLVVIIFGSSFSFAQSIVLSQKPTKFVTEADIKLTAVLMPTLVGAARDHVQGEKFQIFVQRLLNDLKTSKLGVSTNPADCQFTEEELKKQKAKTNFRLDGKGLTLTCFNMDYYKQNRTVDARAEVAGTLVFGVAKFYKYNDKDASDFATLVFLVTRVDAGGSST